MNELDEITYKRLLSQGRVKELDALLNPTQAPSIVSTPIVEDKFSSKKITGLGKTK